MESQSPQIAKEIWRQKNKAEGVMLPDSCLYYKATVIKTVWYWHKKQTHRPMEQNREPRNKLTLIQSINMQQRQNIQWEKDSLFNSSAGKTKQLHVKE